MSNSTLVDKVFSGSTNCNPREAAVDTITPHCIVGELSIETTAGLFPNAVYDANGNCIAGREASCNYIIGTDSRVGQFIPEDKRSWCSGSRANDHRAITIECACSKVAPYTFSDGVYNKLIALCVDICKRHNKKRLVFLGDKDKTLNYTLKSDEMRLTAHRWFQNTSCPGDWLYSRFGELADKVNEILNPKPADGFYRVQTGAYTVKENAINQYNAVKAKGFDAIVVQVGGYYKVQVGAYTVKANADAMLAKVQNAGFSAFITTEKGTQVSVTNNAPTPTPTPQPAPSVEMITINQSVASIQKFLNDRYGTGLAVDGDYGRLTRAALAKAFQTELNKCGANIAVDGDFGVASQKAFEVKVGSLTHGSKGIFVLLWQCVLVCNGYNPGGTDSIFGNGCLNATNNIFRAKGLPQDRAVNGSDVNAFI